MIVTGSLLISIGLLAGCVGGKAPKEAPKSTAEKTPHINTPHINTETKFSVAEYGVAGSPRVTTVKRPRKGGGRYQVGKPYKIRGQWYTPKEDTALKQVGLASWYGPNFHGRLTANGEIYDQYSLSGAHPTMPLPSYATVTNLENGRRVTVRINDRGPYAHGRVIDLSKKAAELLGYTHQGVAKVKVEYAGKARMDGEDEQILLASYVGPNSNSVNPGADFSGSGTMIALNEQQQPAGPEAAINSGFGFSGSVPVPTVRPTLFEGIPVVMANASSSLTNRIEQVVYQRTSPVIGVPPRPMAYHDDDRLSEHRFTPLDDEVTYLGEFPDRQIIIEVGVMADQQSLVELESVLGKEAQMVLDGENNISRIKISEKHANQLLAHLHRLGLTSARIL